MINNNDIVIIVYFVLYMWFFLFLFLVYVEKWEEIDDIKYNKYDNCN